MGGLVGYFAPDQTSISQREAYWYAAGIVIADAALIALFHPLILYVFKIATKIRVGCTGLVYRKALNLSKSATDDGLSGKIINLISTDLAKLDLGMTFMHDVWKGPLETIVYGYILYREIGISAVFGIAFLISFIPLQGNSLHLTFRKRFQ